MYTYSQYSVTLDIRKQMHQTCAFIKQNESTKNIETSLDRGGMEDDELGHFLEDDKLGHFVSGCFLNYVLVLHVSITENPFKAKT